MSCITATVQRFETTISVQRDNVVNSVCVVCAPQPELYAYDTTDWFVLVNKEKQPELNLQKQSSGTCSLTYICDSNIASPYLEIQPELIWIYTDWSAYNEVISNLTWNVD